MNVDLIYDTSLSCHATLATLIQRSQIWKGPLCFEDILNSFNLLYRYLARGLSTKGHVYQYRFKSNYSAEENMWGTVESYKRLLGIIMIGQCNYTDDFGLALDAFSCLISDFKATLSSCLKVIIIHNETSKTLKFADVAKNRREILGLLNDSAKELPSYAEIVLLPGNGFHDVPCCMQGCSTSGNRQRYYRFSPLLDGIVRETLLRQVECLQLSIGAQLGYRRCSKAQRPEPLPVIKTLPRGGTCLSVFGTVETPVVGVCINESYVLSDPPAPIRAALVWASKANLDLMVLPDLAQEGKALEGILPKALTAKVDGNRPAPKRGEHGIYEAIVWGIPLPEQPDDPPRLCRMNKLLGDLHVQLGDFATGRWYYRIALRYSSPKDPVIWQSALLTGYAAAMYLSDLDPSGKRRFADVCNGQPQLAKLLSPVLNTSGLVNALDLVMLTKTDSKLPRRPSDALFRANQSIQSLRKGPAILRCVVEVMYKNADYLVATRKKATAIRVLNSLQADFIPLGDVFLFERFYVLARLFSRLGLYHKAGFLHYLLENNLLSVIRVPPSSSRLSPGLTRSSASCLALMGALRGANLRLTSSPALTFAYRLTSSPAGFRLAPGSVHGVVYVCSIVTATKEASGHKAGWPVLQRQLLISLIQKIRLGLEQAGSTVQESKWEECTALLSYLFSLINGWHEGLSPIEVSGYIELLHSLALARPLDQPSLPKHVNDIVPADSGENSADGETVRSSFGRPISSSACQLSSLVELHVDKMPILRSVSIPRLPPYRLPSRMSYDALNRMVVIQQTSTNTPDRASVASKRGSFLRQPTFISNPFQLSSTDTIDWVCNDLGFVEVIFDNPFAIRLELDQVSFELAVDARDSGTEAISLRCVRIIPALEESPNEVILKPFSGCLFEQATLYLKYGTEPGTEGYAKKVVLEPNSTHNRFVFALGVDSRLAGVDAIKWRLCGISYRLLTFGGFRVSLPLNGSPRNWELYTTPEADVASTNSLVGAVAASEMAPSFLASPPTPPIRVCPPLPSLCLVAGAYLESCKAKKDKRVAPLAHQLPTGCILDRLVTATPSFAPSLRLGSTAGNQETKQSLCNIIIDLHPYETRLLPIHLFVKSNGNGESGVQSESFLNVLQISLQTTLSTNKFLQKYNLLMGQFLQILNVSDVRQKLPVKLPCSSAVDHCSFGEKSCRGYFCGTLCLEASSKAFWEAWHRTTEARAAPSPPRETRLVAQLCIELAADVPPCTAPDEDWTRLVIGRCVKVGVELLFLSSAPLCLYNPGFFRVEKETEFDFCLKTELPQELSYVQRPWAHCESYRLELTVQFLWCENVFPVNRRQCLLLTTEWQKFATPTDRSHEDKGDFNADDLLVGLQASPALDEMLGNVQMKLGLPDLLELFQRENFKPLAVATRPSDELLLPLPLPHAFGRLLERSVEVNWTAHLALCVATRKGEVGTEQIYHLPNIRKGRIVPLLPPQISSKEQILPWYFPLLEKPQKIAQILWHSKIWLQLVHRFDNALIPIYTVDDCPVCRKEATSAEGDEPPNSVDPMASHVVAPPLEKMALELYAGIDEDDYLSGLHQFLTRQFSPFANAAKRSCVDLSETPRDFVSQKALMECVEDGLVLHRLWLGLDVFQVDASSKSIASTDPMPEGECFSLSGCLWGQAGMLMGERHSTKPVSRSNSDFFNGGDGGSQYASGSDQSLRGSVVFHKTGNYFVRGYVDLLKLPSSEETEPRSRPDNRQHPPKHTLFSPIATTSHTILFHVEEQPRSSMAV